MNLKNLTIALIISLAYEIVLKLSRVFIPSVFTISPISSITSFISFIIGFIIILFMFLFHKEERSNTKLEIVLRILLGCFVLHFILRLPITRDIIDYKVVRFSGELIGFITAIFLFVLLIFYKRDIPSGRKLIKGAANFVTVMFGIGIINNLYSLIAFTRFVLSGAEIAISPIFYDIMFIIFIITHLSIIYFLYRYYEFKFIIK